VAALSVCPPTTQWLAAIYAAHPALLHSFLLDACVCHVRQFRTGVDWDISPNADGTWKQGDTNAARITATHSIKTVAEHSAVALHSCHGIFKTDSDISGLHCRCQTFADPMRVGAPWLGEMPYIFLILDLLARWMQGSVTGEVVLPTFLSSNVLLLLILNLPCTTVTTMYHLVPASTTSTSNTCYQPWLVVFMSTHQCCRSACLNCSTTRRPPVFRVPWLIIFRSRSTRSRPIELPTNRQTYDETCRITDHLSASSHVSGFQLAKVETTKTQDPRRKASPHHCNFHTHSSHSPDRKDTVTSSQTSSHNHARQGRPSK
jgi:hypothetical protein